jgi:hypothetical protein
MKKAKIVNSPDGLYEVHFPDKTSVWTYTKESAKAIKEKFDTKGIKP